MITSPIINHMNANMNAVFTHSNQYNRHQNIPYPTARYAATRRARITRASIAWKIKPNTVLNASLIASIGVSNTYFTSNPQLIKSLLPSNLIHAVDLIKLDLGSKALELEFGLELGCVEETLEDFDHGLSLGDVLSIATISHLSSVFSVPIKLVWSAPCFDPWRSVAVILESVCTF